MTYRTVAGGNLGYMEDELDALASDTHRTERIRIDYLQPAPVEFLHRIICSMGYEKRLLSIRWWYDPSIKSFHSFDIIVVTTNRKTSVRIIQGLFCKDFSKRFDLYLHILPIRERGKEIKPFIKTMPGRERALHPRIFKELFISKTPYRTSKDLWLRRGQLPGAAADRTVGRPQLHLTGREDYQDRTPQAVVTL